MSKLRVLVSLVTKDNDYQCAQASAAQGVAKRLNVDVEIMDAENDAVTQSTQLLKVIQSPPGRRPDAIVLTPIGGTGMAQVARAAAAAGIGWVVLNRRPEYISELRRSCHAPIFAVSPDQVEIGRIQGRQFAALLPNGGSVLYIQGPGEDSSAADRLAGMLATKPANIQMTTLKGRWTEESAMKSVTSWLQLTTSRTAQIDLVGSQNDTMAMGARKAFEACKGAERDRWLTLPFTGIDGLPQTGQTWVRAGKLTATIVMPTTAARALEILTQAVQTETQPPERTLLDSASFPPIEALVPAR
jgi:ribose transport system substrate-binding protein